MPRVIMGEKDVFLLINVGDDKSPLYVELTQGTKYLTAILFYRFKNNKPHVQA